MKRILVVAVLAVSAIAYAAPAAPAKAAAPAAAKAVGAPDCDMHKAQASMMKDVMASGAKMEMMKMDNGMSGTITADAKSLPAVEKAMASMDAANKTCMKGEGHLCEKCQGMMKAMKDGKVMMGNGHEGMTWTHAVLSNDPETVKMMHADHDAMMASMMPKK